MLRASAGVALVAGCCLAIGPGTDSVMAAEALPGGGIDTYQYSADPCVASDVQPGSGTASAVQQDCAQSLAAGGKRRPPTRRGSSSPSEHCFYVQEPGFVPSVLGTTNGPSIQTCDGAVVPVRDLRADPSVPAVPIYLPPADPSVVLKKMAQSATRNLHIEPPAMRLSPGLDQPQVVNAPVWFYLDPGSWRPVSSAVSAAGVTVTATATPTSVTWTSGDGGSVTCTGPGTPYPATDPNPPAASPTCGHAFTRASSDLPGGVYPLKAEERWDVAWRASNGMTGTLPQVTTSAEVQVRVVEVQALVTGVRS